MPLDLPLTEFASLLQGALQRYLADHPRPDWNGLATGLGLMSVGIPEASGGAGGGAIERAVVMAELGPALADGDWLAHHLAASLLARLTPSHELLGPLAGGAVRIALALGGAGQRTFAQLAGGATADWLLVATPAGAALHAVIPGARRERAMRDGSVTADFDLVGAGETLGDGGAAHAWAREAQLLGRCCAIAGLATRMLADTADYLQQRRQFGVPIATFQVLRHRMADMAMTRMKAAALIERAVIAEAASLPDWRSAVAAACAETIDAARIVGEGAVQCHGAMGLTEELALGGRFKRALALASSLGPRSGHLATYAGLAA